MAQKLLCIVGDVLGVLAVLVLYFQGINKEPLFSRIFIFFDHFNIRLLATKLKVPLISVSGVSFMSRTEWKKVFIRSDSSLYCTSQFTYY